MRTSLTIDDQLSAALKEQAHQVLARSMGTPRPAVNLDRALELADALEDKELRRKLSQPQ